MREQDIVKPHAEPPGNFQYQSQNRPVTQHGSCQLQFDEEKFAVLPETGAPLVFDLGDVDAHTAADYEMDEANFRN